MGGRDNTTRSRRRGHRNLLVGQDVLHMNTTSSMQPTVQPWEWMSWERRARARAREYPRTRVRLMSHTRDPDKLDFYDLMKDSRRFIRLESLGKTFLFKPWAAPSVAPVTWRGDRFSNSQLEFKNFHYEPISIDLSGLPARGAPHGAGGAVSAGVSAAARGAGGAAPGWREARGWMAALVLCALLVAAGRVAERHCFGKKLFRSIYVFIMRRQEPDEWSTPNVAATSLNNRDVEVTSIPPWDVLESVELGDDAPPSYSECAHTTSAAYVKYLSDESPPPYSACHVPYTDDDQLAGVHVRYTQHTRGDEQPHSTGEMDNVQNDLIESENRSNRTSTNSNTSNIDDIDPEMKTELVFDSGRIVERASQDVNSNNTEVGLASNNNVEDIHAGIRDHVVYVDVTTEITKPGRVSFA